MGAEEASKKAQPSQSLKFVVTSNWKLAGQWVESTSKLEDYDKSSKVNLESRPVRLGIGAAVPRETKVVHSNDPVERKLQAKLDVGRRKVVKNAEESALKDGISCQDSDDEELESRTQAFAKKRPAMAPYLLANKKQR